MAWSDNSSGQLGNGTLHGTDIPSPITTNEGNVFSSAIPAAAGYEISVIRKTDGTVWVTGSNDYGELGDGSKEWRAFEVNDFYAKKSFPWAMFPPRNFEQHQITLHQQKYSCCILTMRPLGGTILRLKQNKSNPLSLIVGAVALYFIISFFTVSPAFSGETVTEGASEPVEETPEEAFHFLSRLKFSLTGRVVEYDNLDETYTSSPLDRFISSVKDPWFINWQEKKLYGTLTYDLLDYSYFRLSSGGHLGVSQAEFSATNQNNGTYEWWRTKPALLWGGTVEAELYREKKQGPFIRMTYDFHSSTADKQKEIIQPGTGRVISGTNDRIVGKTNEKEVSFTWVTHEVQALAGWRHRFLTLLTGISYSRFHLKKRLVNNIVDPYNDPELIAAINGEASRFKYQNEEEFSWLITLGYSVTESIEIIGSSHINNNQDYQLKVQFAF